MKKLCLLFISLGLLLVACNTTNEVATRQALEKQVLAEINQNGVMPNLLRGPCPYNCHDLRCKAYENGYCGPDSIPPPPPDITVVTNSNNPDDGVGAEHNEAVNAILPNFKSIKFYN